MTSYTASFTYQNLGDVNSSWQIEGTGDFNGAAEGLIPEDGILWRNTNGDVELWNSDGSGGFTYQNMGGVNTGWQIAGTGNYDNYYQDSILWRNTSGDVELWNSNPFQFPSASFTYLNLGDVNSSWQIAAMGDEFNGVGGSILWRNTNGDVERWNSGGVGLPYQNLGVVNTSWQIAGTGDFNSGGEDGILWRNTNGDVELWNANGLVGFTYENLGDVNTSWQIAGIGNFNNSVFAGQDGILWRNTTNGDVELWSSNSGGFSYQNLGEVNSNWQIAESEISPANGQDGILWRNTNGGVELWNSQKV